MAASMITASSSICIRHILLRNAARYFSLSFAASGDFQKDNNAEGNISIEENHINQERGDKVKLTGFAKAFAKQVQAVKDISSELTEDMSFATLLKNSSHVHMGNPNDQLVVGNIFHVVGHDLYIDFGGKFHCVCRRPEENGEKYQRGTKVRLRLKDVELTDHFIGATRDISLLEADADLLGLQNIMKPAQQN